MGDLFGRRKLLLVGISVFVAASLIAAAAPSGTVLLVGRLLQGVGGAMILPSTLSTVNAMFTGRERGIAFAIWGSTIGGMAAVGPLVGGWLATDFSWHWAFLINVPIGILIEGQRYGWWHTDIAPTVGSWTWEHTMSPVPFAFAIGVLSIVAFVVVERRRAATGRPVLLDLGLLRIRSLRYGAVAALIVALGEFGMLFALPLYFQGVLGYTALNTGVLVLWLAIGTFLISGGTAQLARRMSGRSIVRIGLLLEVVAVAGLALSISGKASAWVLGAWLFLYGVGVGLATAQLTNVIMIDVPVAESGQASGFQSTVRQLGAALGVAVLGTVLVTTLAGATTSNLEKVEGLTPQAQEELVAVVKGSAGAAIPSLSQMPGAGDAVQTAAEDAMVTAARVTTFGAAGALLVGLLATVGLPARNEHDDVEPATPADVPAAD